MPSSTKVLKHPVAAEQCSTCISRNDGNAVELCPGRLDEIKAYLINGKTHLCHGPDLKGKRSKIACRGGRDFQLQIWARMRWIEEPTDKALEEKMQELGIDERGERR